MRSEEMFLTVLARLEDKTLALRALENKRRVDDQVLERLGRMTRALQDLLDVTRSAIQSGDWEVDGACDPDMAIANALDAIRFGGDPNVLKEYGL